MFDGDDGLEWSWSAMNLWQPFQGCISDWRWVAVLSGSLYVLGCLRWRISGSLPDIISLASHEHLSGSSLLLFEFLLSDFLLVFLHGGIILFGIVAFAITVFLVTTFVKCL
jgi:hypothetical protein